MSQVAVITGLGLVTPLGASVAETWSALLKGRFIYTHANAAHAEPTDAARVDQLAITAAREAVQHAQWRVSDRETPPALVVGTSKGAVTSWIAPLPHMSTSPYVVGGVGSTAVEVGKALGLSGGPRLTLSAACASGLDALIRAAMMIRSGEVDRALVVAAEASLHPLFVGCFQRLGVLPGEGVGCRPFDEGRDGFLVSEAAAAVCLEAAEMGNQSDATPRPKPFAIVDRFAMGGDATHLTGSDEFGSTLRHLLKQVVAGRAIDLVHAHATGTAFNDPIELAAYEDECVHDRVAPLIYSHKGALGHSLGASGLVSIVLNCMMHREQIVLGNVRTTRPIRGQRCHPPTSDNPCYVKLSQTPQNCGIRRSIAVAAGFGGATAAVSLLSP